MKMPSIGTVIGAIAAFVLAYWGWLELSYTYQPPTINSKAEASPTSQYTAIRTAMPISKELTEHPLFVAGRNSSPQITPRPPKPTVNSPRETSNRFPEVILTGVMQHNKQLYALLKNTNTGVLNRVTIGEYVNDWQVSDISADSVLLRQGDNKKNIPLFSFDTTTE